MAPGARTAGRRGLSLALIATLWASVVRAHVGVRQDHLAAKARGGGGERLGDVAEQQAVVRWYAVVEAVDLAIEDVDLAFRQIRAQMVVGAAMTQPHLEHDAGTACYLPERPLQADMLGLQPEQQLLEPRQSVHVCLLDEIVPADLDGMAEQVNDPSPRRLARHLA